MNPMVDMAFLLVSFFMLTTTFKTVEPVVVERPTSQTEIKLPETNVVTITVGKEGRIFFSLDGKFTRQRLLDRMGARYGVQFSSIEKEQFSLINSFGMAVKDLPAYLKIPPSERNNIEQNGIPCDSLQNELSDWLINSRLTNPRVRFSVNADKDTPYELVQQVISTFTDNKIYRFNLVTEYEAE